MCGFEPLTLDWWGDKYSTTVPSQLAKLSLNLFCNFLCRDQRGGWFCTLNLGLVRRQVFYHCSITTGQIGFKPFCYFLLELVTVGGFEPLTLDWWCRKYYITVLSQLAKLFQALFSIISAGVREVAGFELTLMRWRVFYHCTTASGWVDFKTFLPFSLPGPARWLVLNSWPWIHEAESILPPFCHNWTK